MDSRCPCFKQALLRVRDDVNAIISLHKETVVPGQADIQLALLDRPFEQGVE